MTTILTKIKYKGILFEYIQGYASTRHYILPHLISNDKLLQNQLKIFNGILKNNDLSTNFMNNLFTFILDRILFRIMNDEKNIMDNNLYLSEDEEKNKYKITKQRILNNLKSKKYYKEININIKDLKKYLPKEKEFALFLFDYLETKNQILTIFPNYNLEEKNDISKFLSYYENNKLVLEGKEKINQLTYNEIETIYNKLNRKILINLAFIGNKKSGKSTTIGHLLYNTGNIDQNYFITIQNVSYECGIGSYKYSWLVNKIKDERDRCKTQNYHINKFETEKYDFNLIDLPGDFKYRKNMIKGLSLAEAAVIVISAENFNSENDHIKDYLILAYTMGIRQIIVAINKMDSFKEPKKAEKMFLQIKKNVSDLCDNIGFNNENLQFIAYSGYTGHHLVNKYEDEDILKVNKMNWYKGKTLLESIDELKPPQRSFDEPVKISCFKSEKISGIGTVIEGQIVSGRLKMGMELRGILEPIFPIIWKSIEIYYKQINEAIAGDIIGLNLRGINRWDSEAFDLIVQENIINNIKNAANLRVKILLLNKKATLRIGSVYNLFSYNISVPIKVEKIEYLVDEANKILEKEPKEIQGGYAIVIINIIKSTKWFKFGKKFYFFEKYRDNPFFGSFALFDDTLFAVGKIQDINVLPNPINK